MTSKKRRSPKSAPEAIAAIDIGSNSLHLLVAKIGATGDMVVLDSEKVTLRLANDIVENGAFSTKSIKSVVSTVKNFHSISYTYTDRIRAVATHATREASNHQKLIDMVKTESGIDVEIIDGLEEARLSFLGMSKGLALEQSPCLAIDIGGGSSEIIIGSGRNISYATSVKLGVVTLSKLYFEKMTKFWGQVKAAEAHILNRLAPIIKPVSLHQFQRAIATSGTAKTLGFMDAVQFGGTQPGDVNGYQFASERLEAIIDKLISLQTPERIRAFYQIDSSRSEIIIAGALIVRTISRLFRIPTWTVCGFGLREGIIIDTHLRMHPELAGSSEDSRWQNVLQFVGKLGVDTAYAEHTLQLVKEIYFNLQPLLFRVQEKEEVQRDYYLLRTATYLHEVGKVISHPRYHRHSQYIIANSNLMGFTQDEKQLIGYIVRFHRKTIVTKMNMDPDPLLNRNLGRIGFLSACLRLATSLNRTRLSKIVGLDISKQRGTLHFLARYITDEVPEAELQKANRETRNLEKAFGYPIEISAEHVST